MENRNFCAICQSAINEAEAVMQCPGCSALFHLDCWQENGGCAIYGCPAVPPTEHRDAMEIPPSYWGQEHKLCPKCGAKILAAALRCRQCGTVFSTAAPLQAHEYKAQKALQECLPGVRKRVIVFFILCIILFTAPVGVIGSLYLVKAKKTALKALPPLYPGILKIGAGIAVLQTIIMIISLSLFVIKKFIN